MPASTLDIRTDLHGSKGKLKDMETGLEGMQEEAKKSGKSIEQMGEKFKKAGQAMVIAGAAIIAGLGLLTKKASDAQETASKFGTVFQDAIEEANKAVENLNENFGLSRDAAKEMLSSTGDLLTGLGMTAKGALELSEKTQELAVDLASFTNFSGGAKGASEALTKAMLGEREMMKQLGVSMNEKMIMEQVLINGGKNLKGVSLLQAKAEAVLQIAMRQSANAMGDYARTSEDLANKQRELAGDFHDLTISIGEKLIPVATALVNKVSGIIGKIQEWIDTHPELTEHLVMLTLKLGAFLTIAGTALIVIPKLVVAYKSWQLILTKLPTRIAALAGPLGIVIAAMTAGKAISLGLRANWEKNHGAAIRLREEMEKLAELGLKRVEEAYKTLIEITDELSGEQERVVTQYKATIVTMAELTEKYGDNKEKIDMLIASGIVIVKTQKEIDEASKDLAEQFENRLNPALLDSSGKVKKLKADFEALKTPAEILSKEVELFGNNMSDFAVELEGVSSTWKNTFSVWFSDFADDAIANSEGMAGALTKDALWIRDTWKDTTDQMQTNWATMWGDMFNTIISGKGDILGGIEAFGDNITKQFTDTMGNIVAQGIEGGKSFGDISKAMGEGISANPMMAAVAATKMLNSVFQELGLITTDIGKKIGDTFGAGTGVIADFFVKIFGIGKKAREEKAKLVEEEAKAAQAELQFADQVQESIDVMAKYGEISESTAGKIAELRKTHEGYIAEALAFNDVIKDVGVNQENINKLWEGAIGVMSLMHEGQISLADGSKVLDDAFSQLVAGAKEIGEEGSKSMLLFIQKTRELGIEVASVTEFVIGQLDRIPDALTTIINAQEETGQSFESMGSTAVLTFEAMRAEGVSWTDAVDKMRDPLAALADEYEELGIEADDSLKELFKIVEVTDLNKDFFDSVEASKTIVDALGNAGRLTQEKFDEFASQAIDDFEHMQELFGDDKLALEAMAPSLQELADNAEAYGFKIDDNTQRLIDQATEMGLVTEAQETEQEQQERLFEGLGDRMAEIMDDLADRIEASFGRGFGDAFDNARIGADGARGDIDKTFDGMGFDIGIGYSYDKFEPPISDVTVDVDYNFPENGGGDNTIFAHSGFHGTVRGPKNIHIEKGEVERVDITNQRGFGPGNQGGIQPVILTLDGQVLADILSPYLLEQGMLGKLHVEQQNLVRTET